MKYIIAFINVIIYCVLVFLSIYWIDSICSSWKISNGFLQFISWLFFVSSLISVFNYTKFRIRQKTSLLDKVLEPLVIAFSSVILVPILFPIIFIALILGVVFKICGIDSSFDANIFILFLLGITILLNYFIYSEDYERHKKIKSYKQLLSRCDEVENTYRSLSNRINDLENKSKYYCDILR